MRLKEYTQIWKKELAMGCILQYGRDFHVLWTSINPAWNRNKLTKRRLFLEKLDVAYKRAYYINKIELKNRLML